MKKLLGILTVMMLVLLSACSNAEGDGAKRSDAEIKSVSKDIFAMDTYMTVTCYGERCEEAAEAAEKEIRRLERLLSVSDPQSEIYGVNHAGEGALSKDSEIIVQKALEICENTGGAFDITVYPLMELWGFTTGDYAVPEDSDLKEALSHVGSGRLSYQNGTLELKDVRGIDLGGIAKGYTSDRLMELFAEYDLTAGIVSLGGNVELYGTKPDGTLWKCGIRDPHPAADASSLLGVLETKDCAVITSGGYERYFTEENGKTYHHILDPKTGCPADTGLLSVTIVSESGLLADGLSTACFVMGMDDAVKFWKDAEESFDMIFMTEDDEVYITEGLKDSFSSDYPVHVISKT